MNIVFGIRGEKYVQQMITEQLSNFWFLRFKEKDGKKVQESVSHCLQPINFYSFAVPKEFAEQVFTSLKFEDGNERYTYGSFKSKMAMAGMRKAMGLKPIPKFTACKPEHKLPLAENMFQYLHVFPIGYKDDVMGVDEDGYTKEML